MRLVNWLALILKHVSFVHNFIIKPKVHIYLQDPLVTEFRDRYTTVEHDQVPEVFLIFYQMTHFSVNEY